LRGLSSLSSILFAILLSAVVVAAPGSAADWSEVAADFHAARYDAAAAAADSLTAIGGESLSSLYWRFRLTREPDEAVAALAAARARDDCPPALADRLMIAEAWIALGRIEPDAALAALAGVADERRDGGAWLVCGMAERAKGRLDRSREAFASVRPDDPEYAWARTFLGRLAQEEGDRALAERYYRAARQAAEPITSPALLAAAWEMDRVVDPERAADIRRDLAEHHPQSLEYARIEELMKREADDSAATADSAVVVSPAPAGHDRRMALQLAAFSDRSRAMAYLAEWSDTLPGLRIVAVRDQQGEMLYKVRAGSFVTRAEARREADRLQRDHGLRVMVIEAAENP